MLQLQCAPYTADCLTVQVDELMTPRMMPIMTRITPKEQKRAAFKVKDGFAQRGF